MVCKGTKVGENTSLGLREKPGTAPERALEKREGTGEEMMTSERNF